MVFFNVYNKLKTLDAQDFTREQIIGSLTQAEMIIASTLLNKEEKSSSY